MTDVRHDARDTDGAAGTPRRSGAPRAARRGVVSRELLMTLVRARLMVASLALPTGVLMRPEPGEGSWAVLGWAMLAVGLVSVAFWAGARLDRGLRVQLRVQLVTDLALTGALALWTGGRASPFVPFFALVAITGGLTGGLVAGIATAVGATALYGVLPLLQRGLALPDAGGVWLEPVLLGAFLCVMGALAGVLGARVRRTREELARTTRELDRVRVDNDVILRHLTSGVLTVDAWGSIAYVNPAAEQVLGVRTADVRGRAIDEALPPRLQPLVQLVRAALAERTGRSRAEVEVRTGAGVSLPLGVSTNVLTHEDAVTGVVAVFQDLTEVREMERRARRNQTLAEVGALAAGIAHELRNGLTPISGSAEFLERELQLDGEHAVLMKLIAQECGRLNRFVTDLLSFTRDRDLSVASVDLNTHLQDLADVLVRDPRVTTHRLRLRLEPSDPPVDVRMDPQQMRQVWLNLAGNAFEAMSPGGTLTVRARVAGAQVVVEFADQGSGIAPEHLKRIGEPFFTTKEGGTGLGLAIAHRIVERHGGSLAIDGAPGRGAVVRVTLPCTIAAAQVLVA